MTKESDKMAKVKRNKSNSNKIYELNGVSGTVSELAVKFGKTASEIRKLVKSDKKSKGSAGVAEQMDVIAEQVAAVNAEEAVKTVETAPNEAEQAAEARQENPTDQMSVEGMECVVVGDVKYVLCKREQYIEAWKEMYFKNKGKWDVPMFDGINPMLNKAPLASEVDNFCVVAYDTKNFGETKIGFPVGIFSMVVSRNRNSMRPIGKQFVVDPEQQGKGIGTVMMLLLQRELLRNGYSWYYIGCSKMSRGLLNKLGYQEWSADVEHDMYKFNIELDAERVANDLKRFGIE